MSALVSRFDEDRKLLQDKGSLVIKELCTLLPPEQIYREFATILETEQDAGFASTMIQTLNLIALTAKELAQLRALLRQALTSRAGGNLFEALYRSWCHNPVATFSLCLYAQAYEHADKLIPKFADMEVTVPFLVQIDKLVTLLESPVFTHLRSAARLAAPPLSRASRRLPRKLPWSLTCADGGRRCAGCSCWSRGATRI
jgi:vacuole morphology and inheritance protein 14